MRDMEAIYEFIHAEASESAFAWFNDLARKIYRLERFPEWGEGAAFGKGQKAAIALFAFSVCFAHAIPFFHAQHI